MTGALDGLRVGARSILGRSLTNHEADLFDKYLNILVKWQKTARLVGSSDPRWIVENLFLDSLLFWKVLPATVADVLDLGAGAGLPGLPLKIVASALRLTLVESRQRRASFLSSAVRDLRLEDVKVIGERAEALLPRQAAQFDAVVMRCAGRLEDVVRLGSEFVRTGGVVIASGPPSPRPLPLGEWVTVAGVGARKTRRFAVYRRP